MKTITSAVFLLALIILSSASENILCPQNGDKDLIQTGLIEFENSKQRQSCQEVNIKYMIPNSQLQVAASVISTEDYYLSNGVDYAIKVSPRASNRTFVATLLSDFAANWTKIKVSYVASSRSDLIMGSFLTDSFQTLKCI